VSERLRRARRGVDPPARGFGGSALEFFFFWADIFPPGLTYFRDDIFPGRHITGMTYFRDHMTLGGFSTHGLLPMVFYFRLRN
jgi:hypothetical protein